MDDLLVEVALFGGGELCEVAFDARRELVAVGVHLGLDHAQMTAAAWTGSHR
jgi:hypothetical protein